MKKTLLAAASLAALCAATTGTHADTANVPFTGAVVGSCILQGVVAGTLDTNGTSTVMSSTIGGATSGQVQAISTGSNFDLTAEAPTSFTTGPAGADTNTTFAAQYSTSGATSVGTTAGTTATTLNPGVTNVVVDMSATKSSGVFTDGSYSTEVLVRCE